jgi:hypothetical protein
MKPLLIEDRAAAPFKRMPNSVDTFEPNDRFVRAMNKLTITPGIPYHSIIGDHGRGNSPDGSDGIVPYWSSHLDGAQSELVVHSNHNAQYNPQAIAEVRRILRLNLDAAGTSDRSQLVEGKISGQSTRRQRLLNNVSQPIERN